MKKVKYIFIIFLINILVITSCNFSNNSLKNEIVEKGKTSKNDKTIEEVVVFFKKDLKSISNILYIPIESIITANNECLNGDILYSDMIGSRYLSGEIYYLYGEIIGIDNNNISFKPLGGMDIMVLNSRKNHPNIKIGDNVLINVKLNITKKVITGDINTIDSYNTNGDVSYMDYKNNKLYMLNEGKVLIFNYHNEKISKLNTETDVLNLFLDDDMLFVTCEDGNFKNISEFKEKMYNVKEVDF